MKNKIKKYIKKVVKWDENMEVGSFDEKKFPKSLKEYCKENPEILSEHRSIGKRYDRKEFSPEIKKIGEAFDFFSKDVHAFADKSVKSRTEYDNFQSGTPIDFYPFPPALAAVKKGLNSKKLYMYPTGTGNARSKKKFLEYLLREGFKKEKSDNYDGVSIDNIAFTASISLAYSMIIKLIARPEDVIILTGPNYGLFAIEADRYDARVEISPLKEEDNWYVNSKDLAKKIDDVNKSLKKKFSGKLDYTPKVVAFLNMNPHNPIATVMNKKNEELLNAIGDVCLDKGVFVIDDLIYRDLGYDREALALPMAMNPKYFNNTISLFGISKSFGLASLRSGVIVAPIPLIRKFSDVTFQTILSMPTPQVDACIGAFNGSNSRYKAYKKYMDKLIPLYKYQYYLFRVLLNGLDDLDNLVNEGYKKRDVKYLKSIIKSDIIINIPNNKIKNKEKYLKGIPNVDIRKKTDPVSGFFAVLDFTKLKGMKNNDIVINSDKDLLKYLYIKGKVQFIMGSSISWPYEDEIIARISFSLSLKALVEVMCIINDAVRELK